MKNLLYNIKLAVVGLMIMSVITSCLDKEPESAIPEDEAMKSFADAEQTLTGIYMRCLRVMLCLVVISRCCPISRPIWCMP